MVRALTDTTGAVTDTYDYDAYGNLLHSTGATPNNYLFAGEQFDPDLGFYYNRARYLNTSTGRFWSMDTGEGDDQKDPLSLHKYLFTKADPVDGIDPSGNDSIDMTLDSMSMLQVSQYMKGGSAEPRVATAQSDQGITFLKIHEGYRNRPYPADGSEGGILQSAGVPRFMMDHVPTRTNPSTLILTRQRQNNSFFMTFNSKHWRQSSARSRLA